jgi:hypothetical protein
MAGAQGVRSSSAVLHLVFDPLASSAGALWLSRAVVNDVELKLGGTLSVSANAADVPADFNLFQNFPNPFKAAGLLSNSAVTTIRYTIPNTVPREAETRLKIYNTQGQVVRTLINANLAPGLHHAEWDGLDDAGAQVPSGMYFYTLSVGDFRATRKLLIFK